MRNGESRMENVECGVWNGERRMENEECVGYLNPQNKFLVNDLLIEFNKCQIMFSFEMY